MDLNLNEYTDKQIVKAFMKLEGFKFLRVINGISAICLRLQKRGEFIAKDITEDEIEDILQRFAN